MKSSPQRRRDAEKLLLSLCLCASVVNSEIIDRVAVTVGNGMITSSEIRREIRMNAFMEGDPLVFKPELMRQAAERLIDQYLIRREMEISRYQEPSAEAAEQLFRQVCAARFSENQEKYRAALQAYGITGEEFKAHLRSRVETAQFVSFRFRAGIQIRESQIAEYYEQRLLPKLQKNGPAESALPDDYRTQIEQALIEEAADKLFDRWLKETRARTRIEFRQEALQ